MYNSVAFSMLTMLRSHHFWFQNISVILHKKTCLHEQSLPTSPPQPLTTINLLSDSMDSPALDIFDTWDHVLGGLSFLASPSQPDVFEFHPC